MSICDAYRMQLGQSCPGDTYDRGGVAAGGWEGADQLGIELEHRIMKRETGAGWLAWQGSGVRNVGGGWCQGQRSLFSVSEGVVRLLERCMLLVHAVGPCCWSMLLAHAAGPCCWPMLLVYAVGPCCWSMLLVTKEMGGEAETAGLKQPCGEEHMRRKRNIRQQEVDVAGVYSGNE